MGVKSSLRAGLFRYLPGICAFVFTGVSLMIVSIWIAHDSPLLKVSDVLQRRDFLLGVLAGVMVCFFATGLAYKGSTHYGTRIRHAFANKFFALYLFSGVIVSCILVYMAVAVDPMPSMSRWESFLIYAKKEPGGFFAIFTGLPTLYFLALAQRQLWEIRRTLTSFSEILDRVCGMASRATSSNPLHVLAYTPAIGFLARPEDEWHRFHESITRLDSKGKPKAEIICLNQEELAEWHNLFIGRTTSRGKVTANLASEATSASEDLLKQLKRDDKGLSCNESLPRLRWNVMPGYYLFFTRERAIIVVPLFLPFAKEVPLPDQKQLPTVQMVGIETTEKALIQDIEQMYQFYKNLPDPNLAESVDILKLSLIDSWINSTLGVADPLKSITEKFLEACKIAKKTNSEIFTDKNRDIKVTVSARIS